MSGRRVRFGIVPDCMCHDPRQNVERLAALEEAGFDSFWKGDHVLPWQHSRGNCTSVTIMLEAFLQRTQRVTVGAMVLPPIGVRRQPVDVALDVATMAVLHPGRVALCVGTGEPMNEKTATGVWPPTKERIDRLLEAITLIRRCWSSDDYFHHRGKYFNTFFRLYNRPEQPIPLYCAANGPIMAGNAGRYGDGYVAVGVPPEYHRDVLMPAFEAGAREVGRDPSTLERFAWASTSYHPKYERALEGARVFRGLLSKENFHNIQDPRIIEAQGNEVPDDLVRRAFCVATKAETIIAKFEEFIAAGCNHIIWADMSPEPDLLPEICRKEILPYLKSKYGATVGI